MNHAYCPECGSTQYDTNHRCMNCGHAVRVETITAGQIEEGLKEVGQNKKPLPEILAKMKR